MKKKNRSRVISFFLAVLFCLGCFPMSAFAESGGAEGASGETDLARSVGITVTASSNSWSWDPYKIIDDSLTTGWADLDTDEEPTLTFSFASYCDISSVRLYPRSTDGVNVIYFPRTLKFLTSSDGENWTTVKTVTDFAASGVDYQIFEFDSVARFCKYLRIEMSDRTYASGCYHAFFMDAMIMGEKSSSASLTETEVKLARAEALSEHIYNPVSRLIDGDLKNMWSSDGTSADWVILELEKASNVSRVDLYRRNDQDTYPNAFDILVSPDKETWKKVYSFTKNGSVGTEAQSYSFDAVKDTKYIKIDVTSPMRDDQGQTRAQFAEVKVFAMPLIESASEAAEKLTVTFPEGDGGSLEIGGYSELFEVSISSSSDAAVISTDGRFTRPENDKSITLTLTVKSLIDASDVKNKEITVSVAGKETNLVTTTAAGIDFIPLPEHNSTRITYPEVPDALSIEISSSSNEDVVALDGSINRQSETTSVYLTFKVTGASGISAETKALLLPVYRYYETPSLGEAEIAEAHERYESKSFGIFVHYVNGRSVHVSYQDGSVTKSIDEAADAFDVAGFAEDVYSFGAEYVVITCWHEDARTLFPSMTNKRWRDDRREKTDDTTKTYSDRDLIGELLDAFSSEELIEKYGREVDLHLYTHTNDAHDWTEEDQKLVDWNDPDDPSTAGLSDEVWNDYINELYYELCERYASKLKGLWFDGHMKNLDQARLRSTILSVNPAMILVANTGYTTGTIDPNPGWTLCDYRSWESDQHRDLADDMPVSHNQTDYPITNGWWANVKKTDSEPSISNPQSAENIYKYIVAMSSISTSGGMLAATGYYPTKEDDAYPSDHWLTGVKEKLETLDGYITPVSESIRNTSVGRAYPTTELAKVSDNTFFSTESRDGKSIYIHVLNAPSGRTLELGAPADGSLISGDAVILGRDSTQTSVSVEKTSSGYEITLPVGVEWDELDTVIKLARVPRVTIDNMTLKKGDSRTIKMTVTPSYSGVTVSDLKFVSSSSAVSVSEDGVITAVDKGEATVTVSYGNTVVATFKVTVTISDPAKNSAMSFGGFRVRVAGYNGLRSEFSLDRTVSNIGYELVEYGAIVASRENAEKYGTTLSCNEEDGSVSTACDKIKKVPVMLKNYVTGELVSQDKILDSSNDVKTDFCIAIVKYENEYLKKDVYLSAYEVWREKTTGELTVF